MSRILTLKTLKSKKACHGQTELFQVLFGDSVEITPELCAKHAKTFAVGWAARNLLSNDAWIKYRAERNAAYNKYLAEKNEAWDKYCYEENVIWNKYNAEKNAPRDKHITEENVILNKYYAEKNASSDKYDAENAIAFANAYINDVE